jgi:hypothetical protein
MLIPGFAACSAREAHVYADSREASQGPVASGRDRGGRHRRPRDHISGSGGRGDAFVGTYNYDYQIATAGNAGAKIFRSLDDAKKWLGRFGAVREAPPTYSVALLDVKGGLGDRIYDIVSATYTDTSQSLEFRFNWYSFVDAMKPLCVK